MLWVPVLVAFPASYPKAMFHFPPSVTRSPAAGIILLKFDSISSSFSCRASSMPPTESFHSRLPAPFDVNTWFTSPVPRVPWCCCSAVIVVTSVVPVTVKAPAIAVLPESEATVNLSVLPSLILNPDFSSNNSFSLSSQSI